MMSMAAEWLAIPTIDMQHVDLLADLPGIHGVEGFANALFMAIDVENSESRDSSNCNSRLYFLGRGKGFTLTVAPSDEDGHEDLPYWIHVKLDVPDADGAVGFIDKLIQEKILPAGFRIARICNFGKRDERRIDYQLYSGLMTRP